MAVRPDPDPTAVALVLDALQSGALMIDRGGTITHANERFCEWLQRPRSQIIGHRLSDFYDDAAAQRRLQELLDDFESAHDHEFYIPRPDGSRQPVLVAGRPIACGDGPAAHRVVTVMDLTERARQEQQLRKQYDEIANLSDTVLEQALELKRYSQHLEDKVRERTRELHEANMEAITMLAVASEAKDADTGAHVQRIRRYAEAVARGLGLSAAEAERVGYSAILHDVGKMHVPDSILKKPAALSEAERIVVQEHTLVGERILSNKPFFELARSIARSHHENWDGSGYPDGARGEQIPLAARIVRVVDVFDALVSRRAYKEPWSVEKALEALHADRGRVFDPQVLDVFSGLCRAGAFRELLDPQQG